jgi:hypothetical protein
MQVALGAMFVAIGSALSGSDPPAPRR